MLVLNCIIQVGDLVFDFANEIEVKDNWKDKTNTAVIKVAKKVLVQNNGVAKGELGEVIKTGDAVKIYCGYDGKYKLEFIGYVSESLKLTVPLEIKCEDEMYQLKRRSLKPKTLLKAKVSDLIKYIAPDYKSELLDSELGTFIIRNETPAQVLKRLQEESGLYSFFKIGKNNEPVLVVGKPYLWGISEQAPELPEVIYHLQYNVVENDLQWKKKEDMRIKIKAVSILANNKRLNSVFEGDSDGETRSLTYYNLSQAQLESNAKADYNKIKQDSYSGDVTGFGLPHTRAGQIARIVDTEYVKRDEKYFIDEVTVVFGVNGFRRKNTIGFKA